jgi:hypothetical protein
VRVRGGVCVCVRVRVYKCWNAGQSGTGIKKTNDAGTGPVPDQAKAVQHFLGPVPDCNY